MLSIFSFTFCSDVFFEIVQTLLDIVSVLVYFYIHHPYKMKIHIDLCLVSILLALLYENEVNVEGFD